MKVKIIFAVSALISCLLFQSCQSAQNHLLLAGGYTGPGEKGLNIFDFNSNSGELTLLSQNDVGPNPSYFCFSAQNKLLYVANEITESDGKDGGALSTFRYNPGNSSLEKQGEISIPYGGTCFISMSPDSGYLFLANYPKGSVVVVKLDNKGLPETIADTILYVKGAPEVSHAHMIMNDPSGRKIYVTDLGQDMIFRYDFNSETGKLMPFDTLFVPKGEGPRHFDFNKEGSRLYIINELGSKIIVFSVSDKPEIIQTISTVKEGFKGKTFCADLHLSSDGKYLYGTNRGENSIATFAVQPDGTLKPAGNSSCGGNWPRNFTIDPLGNFILVANQRSDSIAVFRIDRGTGLISPLQQKYFMKSPACLKFVSFR
ncbi:MAG TPA: lactonase family protein [Bacteroidales bacterium]|nr:lactonase family protein [Bacteroidales bacterium]